MFPLLHLTLAWGSAPDAPAPGPDAEARIDAAAALRALGAEVDMDDVWYDQVARVGYKLPKRPPAEFWKLLKLCPDLEDLDFIESGVEDDDLIHLKELPRVGTLWLTYTKASDGCLDYLRDAPGVKKVFCDNSRITRAGVRKLKKARPTLWVFNG
jgi:hypothetical protein